MMTVPITIDYQAVRSGIQQIRGIDLRVATIEQIKDMLTSVIRGHVVHAPSFDPGLRLYRARKFAKMPDSKPLNLSEVWYPSRDLVPMGRVNRKGEPVLYCATLKETAIFEVQPSPGEMVAVGTWLTTKPLQVNHVGYTNTTFQALGSVRRDVTWGKTSSVRVDELANREITEFLSQTFCCRITDGNEHLYKLTIAIAEKMFLGELFQGLVYPTIQMRANADNFAIKTDFADSGLVFQNIEFLRVDSAADFSFNVTTQDFANQLGSDGQILWKGRPGHWAVPPGQAIQVSVENGRYVAHDLTGKLLDLE
jgi:hypothetical protein